VQAVPQVRGSHTSETRPLSALVDDVMRSARGVALQGAELARLDLEEGVKRGALGMALLLSGCVFLGVVAALLWGSLLWGVVWLAAEWIGVPVTLFALWSGHAIAAVAGALAIRARLRGTREEPAQ